MQSCIRRNQFSKHSRQSEEGIPSIPSMKASTAAYALSEHRPRNFFFTVGNTEKSQSARSGKIGRVLDFFDRILLKIPCRDLLRETLSKQFNGFN